MRKQRKPNQSNKTESNQTLNQKQNHKMNNQLPSVKLTEGTIPTCPHSKSKLVKDSYRSEVVEGRVVIRRVRECLDCKTIYHTLESTEDVAIHTKEGRYYTSAYLYTILRRGAVAGVKPIGWVWSYNSFELRERLMNTLPQGYIWNDFLNNDLHITHAKPLSEFGYPLPNENVEFIRAWALDNLKLVVINPRVDAT